MLIFVLLFIFVCLYQVKLNTGISDIKYFYDYMSIEKTNAIKGIFIIFVFFRHFSSYVTYTASLDKLATQIFSITGQTIVTMFLFYSGYGIMESIKKKKYDYIKSIPKRRILSVLFRFDIAILLFAFVDLIVGNSFTLSEFVFSLIGWDSIGNSNWYIFIILVCYLLTYISFMIFKNKKDYAFSALFLCALIILFVIIFHVTKIKSLYWYNTILCYPLGILFSLYKSKIEKFIMKNSVIYFCTFAVLIAITGISWYFSEIILFDLIMMLSFTLLIVLLTMKCAFNNKILQWFGSHLFEFYILQRIPMIVFQKLGLNSNIYIYFILSFAVMLIIGVIFKLIVDKLWMKISAPRKSS